MPTPFTHLKTALRLLNDEAIPPDVRASLDAERGAFLLGNIAADARVSSGLRREDTHFYTYDIPITGHPWRVMMRLFPELEHPQSAAQRAFLAGYVAHLCMDEVWLVDMLKPQFVEREWGTRQERFLMLHMILIYMDERDYAGLAVWQREALARTEPHGWLPFMSDDDLRTWRDYISQQMPPGGTSETVVLLGERVGLAPDAMRAILESPDAMQAQLWANVDPAVLARVEADMYALARGEMLRYWAESAEKK
jgi:hypothetical protein